MVQQLRHYDDFDTEYEQVFRLETFSLQFCAFELKICLCIYYLVQLVLITQSSDEHIYVATFSGTSF